MKRGRKPKSFNTENLLRRSNRSRKESFKIKLFNATRGKLATTELIEEISKLDENGNDIQTPVHDDAEAVMPKRKRGRPRKNPVVVKENPRDLLAETSCTISSPIEPSVFDVSTESTINGEDLEFLDTAYNHVSLHEVPHKKKNVLGPQKVKTKKTYTYEPILPPCKVCGAKASGYHFGAITCEACKVFFRRSLTRQTSYHCNNNGNCEILPNRRISCSFCRLKKCGDLGMSRDGIQRGRYTVERKTECIRKVKELEIMKREKAAEHGYLDDDYSLSPVLDISPCVIPKVEINTEMEKFIKAIVKADSGSLMVDEDQMNHLLQLQANYIEYLQLRDSVFGPMDSLTSEEYHDVYKNTGIDLGNRRQKFAKCIFSFVTKITKFIEFAKSLPGFLELSITDQITLLREGMIDWVFISGFEVFNSEQKVFTCSSCHHTWSRDEFDAVKDQRFFFQSFVATAALKKLHLYNDERAILKALVIFSPDGSEGQVEDKSFIERYQQRLLESLLFTLRKNHHLDDSRLAVLYGRIVHGLTEVKDAAICYKLLIDECLDHFPDVEFPELFVEILGDDLKGKLESVRAACASQNSSLHSSAKLSTSSSDSTLSQDCQSPSEIVGEDVPVWVPDAPVLVQPTYDQQMNIFQGDGTLLGSLVDSVAENSVDYSQLVRSSDGGTDRVLLLAQL